MTTLAHELRKAQRHVAQAHLALRALARELEGR